MATATAMARKLLAEHLGSCVTCFRAMTELRDAPRVAEALRAETPRCRARRRSLLGRARGAHDGRRPGGAATLRCEPKAAAPATSEARARRSAGARTRIFSVAATLAAAAAGFLLVARHPTPVVQTIAPGLVAPGAPVHPGGSRASG